MFGFQISDIGLHPRARVLVSDVRGWDFGCRCSSLGLGFQCSGFSYGTMTQCGRSVH